MLLSEADPALRHSVTWKFPIIQGSYTIWDSWSNHSLSLWICIERKMLVFTTFRASYFCCSSLYTDGVL